MCLAALTEFLVCLGHAVPSLVDGYRWSPLTIWPNGTTLWFGSVDSAFWGDRVSYRRRTVCVLTMLTEQRKLT